MKFLDSHFDEYIKSSHSISLHPLNAIKKYSPSEFKYEKKLTIIYNKVNYFFKISDIHFEIDMALLGCNSKLLWNEIYTNIVDVLSARTNKSGIIVCKNFHKIHSELLDCFYSYIQENNINIHLIYILITENISFIPDNIINHFHTISIPRPSKTNYNKILPKKLPSSYNLNKISNIKNIITNTNPFLFNIDNYIESLYENINNPNSIKFLLFRDLIYDIFIYDMEIGYVIWGLIQKIVKNNNISIEKMTDIHLNTFSFLQYYNNNYRPIYHLENYLYNLINTIHEF